MIKGALAVVLLGLVLSTGSCGGDSSTSGDEQDPSASPGPVLLTLDESSGGSFTALVSGELTLNEANCFQVGDAILVAEYGSTALPDGSGVDMPGFGEVKIGSRVQGTGGELPPSGPGVPGNDWQRCVPAGSTDAVFTSLHKGSPRDE